MSDEDFDLDDLDGFEDDPFLDSDSFDDVPDLRWYVPPQDWDPEN